MPTNPIATPMASIRAYSAEVEGREEKYILHGSTFFNGRWKDHIPETMPEARTQARQEQQAEPDIFAECRELLGEDFQEFLELGIVDDDGALDFGTAKECGKIGVLRRLGLANDL